MAEIRTAIQIVDGFSPAFKSMNSALNIVTATLADTQRQLGKPVDVTAITAAQREFAEAATAIDKVGVEAAQAATKQNSLNSSFSKGESSINGLVSKVKGLVAAYASFETIKGEINAADTYADTTSRLDLMKDSKTSVAELESMIRKSADSTLSSFKSTADAVAKMGIQAGDAFTSNKELVGFVEQVNKHMKIAGTSTAAAEGAMMQLTQAMSNGVLRGEELNSVLDGMPTVAKSIEKYFKQAGYDLPLKEIAEKGLITSQIVKDALFSVADETNKKFDGMKTTFSDLWTIFTNRANEALKPVYERLTAISSSPVMRNLATGLGNAIGKIGEGVVWVMDKIEGLFGFIQTYSSIIKPIIGSVALGFLAWGASIAWVRLQALYHAIASGVQTVALIALEFATNGAKAGFIALAGAMSINPVMLFVYAVIALIGIFYAAVAAVNHFANTNISATGVIIGAFAGLGSFIYNQFMYLWNTIISFAEFLINVFQNPIYSIKALFVTFGVNFLDVCISMTKGWDEFATGFANAFLDAINWVIRGWNKLIDMLPDNVANTLGIGKGTEFTARTSITTDLTDAKERLQASLGERPETYIEIPRAKYMDVGSNAKWGYNVGKNLGDKASNKVKELKDSVNALMNDAQFKTDIAKDAQAKKDLGDLGKGKITPDEFKKKYPDIAKKLDKIAGNTSGLDSIPEDLELIRAIGEREAINRFTTAEIKVNTTNNNNVSSGFDLDKMINEFTEKLRDAMSVAAEGSHV